MVSDGCIINHADINHSVIGLRSIVGVGTRLDRVVLMGSDYYESQSSIVENEMVGKPKIGIGQHCRIENAIIDKNARIGDNVIISPVDKPENLDHPLYCIRDGVVVIPKNGVIPHGMVI
jgi:glucose-1-phosphate adenylyltransferase